MIINGRKIGTAQKPYIIAEISANHNGSLERAKRIIRAAKESGADAVKLQTYTADTLTIDSDMPGFLIDGGLWDGRTLYELYDQAHTPWSWHGELFQTASDLDITIFSSPFDKSAIDLLEGLGAPAYKIASFEIVDLSLIAYAASTGKPLIISTGLASLSEIDEAVEVAKSQGCEELALLHCLSSYPAPSSEYKLHTIPALKARFNLEIGLSDHTVGNLVPAAAVALGATILEKHFTENTQGGGPDDIFSMDSNGLSDLRTAVDVTWSSLGFDDFARQVSEQDNLRFKRSLYFVKDLAKGDIITSEHVRSIRPGFGVHPKHLESILGKKISSSALRGMPLTPEILENLCNER